VAERPVRGARVAGAAAAAVVLCGCGYGAADEEIQEAARPVAAEEPAAMSYEVAIAIAAANRNRALEQCAALPAAERGRCRAEVQSDWDVAQAALKDLRGDQG
jgi:ABC-type uncharacterized transport system auxiliary subunit